MFPTNSFRPTCHQIKNGEERAIMRTIGVLVDMLLELDSETYGKNSVFEKVKKVMYVVVLRAIYGILLA